MTLSLPFDNSYARLPDRFFTKMAPTPVDGPSLIRLNEGLAAELGLDPAALRSADGVAMLAGNAVPAGAEPLAQVYAGHQFGGWSPQLGDGRAILLGEVVAHNGQRRDIQLKGAGRTPYSRLGDGRAWLGPVLREYIVSEAMHALGIPTTRALAAVATGEDILRETALPGAVLTRVAASHIRVGTFQYFAARNDAEALRALTDHVIARHYPDASGPLGLLKGVIAAQAKLIAQWMGVGFIHGVMNTDNMAISGETIDYGPCAFMDGYHPTTVFSSIDRQGRYAYNKQADIGVWNLAQLATAILPLLGDDQDAAIDEATEVLHSFPDMFKAAWLEVFRAKVGLTTAEDGDAELIHQLLDRMATNGADFTNTFRALSTDAARDQFSDPTAFDTWAEAWKTRLSREAQSSDARKVQMNATNPAVIPRNHRVEEVIQAALSDDFAPFENLLMATAQPFGETPASTKFTTPPTPAEVVHQTFCGT
ncbi:protein adenylyltransferase SelO [Actibacterium lipolyticum]|uniref:Protein nucleotidyltransferase YdiU n=1 Tax=Actibacterium lipolyticum TaxID=1524263 RepID=A0A238KGH7_9RHOB|nr:YdiU family protein [Actibacterium lipolyticum]SMX41861.1 hypothetical protein COL8621_01841 [Actibacterium lipolyticum]